VRSRVDTHNKKSLSNGMLMRISPLAIAFRNRPYVELKQMAEEDAQLTHCHPMALEATAIYVGALASLMKGVERQEVYQEALGRVETPLLKEILEDAKSHATPVRLAVSSSLSDASLT